MKKRLPILITVIALLYAAIFGTIMLITIFLPSAVYDNQKLLIGGDRANKINYKLSIHDGITTVNCDKMTGADTLWKQKADCDMKLQMDYMFQVTKGKAKLILVNPDDTVITLAECDSDDTTDAAVLAEESTAVLDLKKGENRVKIVCEKGAAFSLSFKIAA